MVFDRSVAVTIPAERGAELFDGRRNEIGFEEEPTAVLIFGGHRPDALCPYGPSFRSAPGTACAPTRNPLRAADVWRMTGVSPH